MPTLIDPAKLAALQTRLEAEQRRLIIEAAEIGAGLTNRALDHLGAIEGTLATIEAVQEEDRPAAQSSEPDRPRQPSLTGTVKWFNEKKGFGFIVTDGDDSNVFVHISAVERSGLRELQQGQRVAFEMMLDQKTGKQAAGNLNVLA